MQANSTINTKHYKITNAYHSKVLPPSIPLPNHPFIRHNKRVKEKKFVSPPFISRA